VSVLSCGEADNPARQGPVHRAGNGPFQRSGRGIPVCLGTALGQPISVGARGQARGQCSARLLVFRQDAGTRLTRFADGWPLCLPAAEKAVPGHSGRNPRGTGGGTASLRPLSCGKDSSCAVGTGWRRLSPPSLWATRAGPRGVNAVGGSRDGTPDARAAGVSRYYSA
jgi:hypothetical protein